MKVMYTIHRIGTPVLAIKNHWTYDLSEYWNDEDGWGHKSEATVYSEEDKMTLNLPMEGEWIEIYVNEPVGDFYV